MAKKYLGENAVGQFVQWAIGKFAALSHKHTKSDITDFPVVLTGGKQTATSTADGGENVYTFSDSAGKTSTLIVRNGTKGSNGNTGATGKGISSTAITYQASASGTTIPTADDWSTSIPATSAGQYLWTRIIITFSDKSTVTAYSVSRNGTNGTNGKNGTNGTNGTNGAAATITVGTVTTGAAGSAATVKNSGTSNAAVLDFTIPRGATGATGAAGKNGTNGARGSRWSTGTAITGTSTTATVYATGITDALINDMYLNTSTGLVYRCTVAGNASTAKWMYAGSIKGATGAKGAAGANGADGQDGLTTKVVVGGTTFTHSNGTITVTNAAVQKAVTPTAPTSGQVAIYDGTTGQMKSSGYTIATSVPAGAKFTDTNTDTKVTQTLVSDSANYPLLLAPKSQTANATTTACFDSGVYLDPSTNTITANITGNAANVTGTVAVAHGGTGVTSITGTAGLLHALFDNSITNAGYVPVFTTNWADGGYMSIANLRSALSVLPLAGGTVTGTLILSRTTDLSGLSDKRPALIVGGLPDVAHIEMDANEIQAKATATTVGTMYINPDGGAVGIGHNTDANASALSIADAQVLSRSPFVANAGASGIITVVSGSGNKTTALPAYRTKALITAWTTGAYGTAYITGLSENMAAGSGGALFTGSSTTMSYAVAKDGAITTTCNPTSIKWTIIYFN